MIASISGIPVYEALVGGDDEGMVRISLVDDPAVMSNWQKFSATATRQMYAVADEDKRIVRGVVMRSDFPIYRRDAGGEYYVIYHADTIRLMAEKYLAESRQNRIDTNHDGNEVDGVQMVQWYIKDTAAGIDPQGFAEDIADGSLFAEFHITDDGIWQQVKDGTFRGFSLEGYFTITPEQEQQSIDSIVDELAGQFNIQDMSKVERIKEILRAELALQEVKTPIQEMKEKIEVALAEITTNRGPLEWDGEEDLKAGDRVYIIDEEGNRTDATDGDYITEDGKTIVVADGVVAEIRDPEAEVAPEQDAAEQEQEAAEVVAEVVAEVQAEAEQPEEIEVEVEAAAEEPEINGEAVELRRQLEDAQATIETLKAELEAARKKPMAQPAHEEVKASAALPRTGIKRLDRFAELMGK